MRAADRRTPPPAPPCPHAIGRRGALNALAALLTLGTGSATARSRTDASPPLPRGSLMVIGGAEDRRGEKEVLRRFVAACTHADGRARPRIAVLPAASAFPQVSWERYDAALADLGVAERVYLAVHSPADAADPQWVQALREVDGVLMGGGNQRRLVETVGGTPVARALHEGHMQGRLCIAGSSAGAAALSQHMLVGREVGTGLGLLPGAIVDQHFTERRRLPRLAAAVTARPGLLGIGVDEDTALIVHAQGFEVVGRASVTLVHAAGDAEQGTTAVDPGDAALPAGVQLLRLPAGSAHEPTGSRRDPRVQRLLAQALRRPAARSA